MQSVSSKIVLVAIHAGYSHSSLALALLKAACVDEPFYADIAVVEHQEKAAPFWLIEGVVDLAPRLIGFSCYLWNIELVLDLAGRLKQLLPESRILLGGPEAGPRARELLAAHGFIDYVIEGEGESAFRELASHVLATHAHEERIPDAAIPGVWRRTPNGEVTGSAAPLPDLEQRPSPLLLGLLDQGKPLIYWETSRGCPFRCTFCGSAEERLRLFPMQRVMAELEVIAGQGNKTVKLLDRSFHLGKRRTLELLRRFADTPPGLRFHLELNPDRISDEAMAIFAHAAPGKFQFEIGLQTLDDGVLSAIDREMDVARALERIARLTALRRHPVHLDLLAGLPDETFAQCVAALDRTFRLFPDHLQLGVLKLLPGTPLRRSASDFGYLWSDRPPYEILAHRCLGFAELARLKRYAELLERLWNNDLLRHTLMALTQRHCGGEIRRLFDRLLDTSDELALQRPGPERIFALVVEAWREALEGDETSARLLLWDYLRHTAPSSATPPWIAERIPESRVIRTEAGNKRLPVMQLEGEPLAAINRLRGEPIAAGLYGVWPRKHRKGAPLELYPISD